MIAAGLGWGLAAAACDCVLMGIMRAGTLHTRGGGVLFNLEGFTLLAYLPAAVALSAVAAALFRRRAYNMKLLNFLMGTLLFWLVLMSVLPPLSRKDFLFYAVVNLVVAMSAGYGLSRVTGALPRMRPADAALFAVSAFAAAMAGLNAGLVFIGSRSMGLFSVLIVMAAISMAVVLLCAALFLALWRKGSRLAPIAVVALCIPAAAAPALWWKRDWSPGSQGAAPPGAPHIVFIVSDALRADSLTPERTPNLCGLMSEGANFLNAQSTASWTYPSMAAIMSSRDPRRLKVRRFVYKVPKKVPLLSEELYSRGYKTCAFSANWVVSPRTGMLRGFSEVNIMNHEYAIGNLKYLPVIAFLDQYARRGLDLPLVPHNTPRITDLAIKSLKEPGERPVFLYLHYMDPHDPLAPPPEFAPKDYDGPIRNPFTPRNAWHVPGDLHDPQMADLREGELNLTEKDVRFVTGLYNGEVQYLDRELGRMFELFPDGKAPDKRPVLVVFTSDHGEELWDHGDFGHAHTLLQEVIHVPLFMWGAGVPRTEVKEPVTHLQLMPTLREMLGVAPDPGAEGRSLLPLMRGRAGEVEPAPCYSSELIYFNPRSALRLGRHKLIHDLETSGFTYFDLTADPGEMNPLDPGAAGVQELQSMLLRHEKKARQTSYFKGKDFPGYFKGMEKQLKAMGYIK